MTEFGDERDSLSRKREATRSFDATSDSYRTSDVHREGTDLEVLAAWCRGASSVLDVACGAGHTAGAVAAPERAVVACDAAPRMVRTTVEDFDVSGVVGDAECLPFRAGVFDAVTCRIAAHHFPDPAAFVAETARVLEEGGIFAFEDNTVPDVEARLGDTVSPDGLGAFLDRVERLRDPTHVESYSPRTWQAWLEEAGFDVRDVEHTTRRLTFADWVERTDPGPAARARLEQAFAAVSPAVGRALGVERDADGAPRSFLSPKVLIRAVREKRTD